MPKSRGGRHPGSTANASVPATNNAAQHTAIVAVRITPPIVQRWCPKKKGRARRPAPFTPSGSRSQTKVTLIVLVVLLPAASVAVTTRRSLATLAIFSAFFALLENLITSLPLPAFAILSVAPAL